ncbi:MAG: ABC transporter permease subunit [Eubacteriales bacterium]
MKTLRDYLKQIKTEIKKMLKSKGLIVFTGLFVLFCASLPVLVKAIETKEQQLQNEYYYYIDSLTINGIDIASSNPFYYEIRRTKSHLEFLEKSASSDIDDLMIDYEDEILDYYFESSKIVENDDDFRVSAVAEVINIYEEIFIISHLNIEPEDMIEALKILNIGSYDETEINDEYYSLSEEERKVLIAQYKSESEKLDNIIFQNDYMGYLDYLIENEEKHIKDLIDEIERLEQSIVGSPSMETLFSDKIEEMRIAIRKTEEIDIPILEYRKENYILIDSSDWRDYALNSKKRAQYFFVDLEDPMTEKEYYESFGESNGKTYKDYIDEYDESVENNTERLMVSENSLASGKPDMRYVYEGSRQRVENFLSFNVLLIFFVIIIGGSLASAEFKNGTARLLFIRPKNRVKIILSRFFGLIALMYIVYFSCVFINMISNGFVFGFKDFGYPNYTMSSGSKGVSFFAYMIPKNFLFTLPIIFFAAFAYFMSIATKNTSASVSIPFVLYIASIIFMEFVGYDEKFNWISYTPLPYFAIESVLWDYYEINTTLLKGVSILLGLSIIFVVLGNIILKKRDIQC